MIKNHFPTVKIIETTLAKILDKLAKFSKLNFLNLGSYFYLVYSI